MQGVSWPAPPFFVLVVVVVIVIDLLLLRTNRIEHDYDDEDEDEVVARASGMTGKLVFMTARAHIRGQRCTDPLHLPGSSWR
jgi:hypothetical protein